MFGTYRFILASVVIFGHLWIRTPGMDGFEVCRRIRAESPIAQVPIIMITAVGDAGSRLRSVESGADDFLSKPFDLDELLGKIQNISKHNRLRGLPIERGSRDVAPNEVQNARDAAIEGWPCALESPDNQTPGDTYAQVTEMTMRITHAAGVREEEID